MGPVKRRGFGGELMGERQGGHTDEKVNVKILSSYIWGEKGFMFS